MADGADAAMEVDGVEASGAGGSASSTAGAGEEAPPPSLPCGHTAEAPEEGCPHCAARAAGALPRGPAALIWRGAVYEPPSPEDPRRFHGTFFHQFAERFEDMAPLQLRKGKVLSEAINGEVVLCGLRTPEGERRVAVKLMPNAKVEATRRLARGGMNEDALTEIGVLQYLRDQERQCDSVLRMLHCFRDPTHTWLVTEFCDSSDLFNLVCSEGPFSEERLRGFLRQLLQAVDYLHEKNVGHRDISLENILVSGNGPAATIKLMDFGMAVLLRTRDGTPFRYTGAMGKPYYRAPEMYTPPSPAGVDWTEVAVPVAARPEGPAGTCVQVALPNGYMPEVRLPASEPGLPCRALLAGYAVEASDMFACGVSFFILHTCLPPWSQMALPLDPWFKYYLKNGLPRLIAAMKKPELPPEGMALLGNLLSPDPASRLSSREAARHPFIGGREAPAEAGAPWPGAGTPGAAGAAGSYAGPPASAG